MLNQRKELNFEGQNIYIGIDVHLKSWTVTILTETMPHKTFTQPPQAQILSAYLNEHFPNADYYSIDVFITIEQPKLIRNIRV